MKFSPSDWHGKFEGSADYFAPNLPKGSAAKGRMSPVRGRSNQKPGSERTTPGSHPPISPFSQPQYQSYPIPPPPPGPPPNLNFPPTSAASPAATFKPEEWADTFKEPTWVFSEQRDTSPRRATDAAKRPKAAARKGSVAQDKRSATQDGPNAKQSKKYQATADDATNGEPDAMDIDTNTPPVATPAGNAGPTGTSQTGKPNGSATAPSSNAPKAPAVGLNGMGGLAEPLGVRQEGALGLSGLGDNLPFTSQASAAHPLKSNSAQKLKYPSMPVAPKVPQKLDQVFADLYFSQFESYVKDYSKARKAMTAHFAARETELASDLDHRFAHHRGETTKKLGFSSYLARMKEDEQVLETWKLFQETHLQALAQCEEVRNKTMKLYQTPLG